MMIHCLLVRIYDVNQIFIGIGIPGLLKALDVEIKRIETEKLPDDWKNSEKVVYRVEAENRIRAYKEVLEKMTAGFPQTIVLRRDSLYVKNAMEHNLLSQWPEVTLLVREAIE